VRGHIKQRSKGTWSLVVFLGRDPVSGKKRYKWRTVKGTKKQAESELNKLLREIETGTDLEPGRLTTAEFLEQWLDASRSRVGPRTWERYAQLMRLHVVPVLGSIPLGKLRPLHLERLYSKLLGKGLAARTVLHVHRVLHSSLHQAVRWQLVSRNVAGAVTPPRPVTRDIEAIDPDQAVRLVESVKGTLLEVPVVLALGTGMRRGEVLGLRWVDIDLSSGRARIAQTLQATQEGLRFLPPKTHRSKRSVSLPAFVVEMLRRHRKEQNERRLMVGEAWHDHDLVIDRGNGEPLPPHTLSQQFRAASKAAGLDLNFHGLRHAHASLMLAGGIHLKVVSERLGHSTIAITADLYSHVNPRVEDQAAAALDALLRQRRSERGT
jgi:integrase